MPSLGIDLTGLDLWTEANSFGFNQMPPIDLPTNPFSRSFFPSPGYVIPADDVQYQNDLPQVAFSALGQGEVQATPLKMALVAAGIANQGVIMKPHVMHQILNDHDQVLQTYQPSLWLRATTPTTAAALTPMMQQVVTNGTADKVGFPASWDVAAKTGTAQAGVLNTNTTDWMIVFAPANDPKYAIAVVVPHQSVNASGAGVAGPIVKAMFGALFGGR